MVQAARLCNRIISMETEHDYVASVRRRARHNEQTFRMKKRSMLWNSRRLSLDSVIRDTKIPNVEELAQFIVQLKKKKDLETLQKLRLSLGVRGEIITAFLNTEGAIYSLVGCLSGTDAELQTESLCTLINLALGTEEECAKVQDAAGIYIALIISNKTVDLQHGLCAWCIGNLCGGHELLCKQLQLQDIPGWLLKLLRCRLPHVFQSTAYALTHFFATVPEKMRTLEVENFVCAVLDGLENVHEATVEASWLLFVMTTDPVVCDYLLHQGVIRIVLCCLEKIIHCQSLDVPSATALNRVLINCVGAFPDAAVQVCHRGEQFVTVCKALLYSPHPHLRAETMQMIANVINSASQYSNGSSAVDEINLRAKLDSSLRSALASNFSDVLPTSNMNVDTTV